MCVSQSGDDARGAKGQEGSGVKLRFIDVGRNKQCWDAEVCDPLESGIIKSIKKHGQLMSKYIEFTLDLDTGKGSIFAGLHIVGKIEVVNTSAPSFAQAFSI